MSFYHHPKGGFRPKKPDFSLAKEPFVFSDIIDTLAIYTDIEQKVGDLKSVSYIKFYNNGRCFVSIKSIGQELSSDSFRPLDVGYYRVVNNKVTIETFIVDPLNRFDTKYIIDKGIVKDDTIFLESRFIEGKKDVYVKQKLNFSPEPSDW